MNRRSLLKALGLGALAPTLSWAGPRANRARVVFFVQPHGHVPSSWRLPIGGTTSSPRFAARDLSSAAEADLSPVLKPLYPFRSKLLAVDGLTHTATLDDIAYVTSLGSGDINNHDVGVADLLTGSRSAQHPGFPCVGGARSIDQELALRTVAPGRFGSRVWGAEYRPNQAVAPFSFLGPSQASPIVTKPADAFLDLLATQPRPDSRAKALAALRPSVLDSVAEDYRSLGRRLGADDRRTLEAHASLVRDLEQQLVPMGQCSTAFDATGPSTRQFMQLVRLAFACDLTRVVTYVAPVPACPEFGYPANADVHGTYAHASVQGVTSCGAMYSPVAEQAMTALSVWYAGHVAALASELDAVPDGEGTLLDSTLIVWVTELGTPVHQHTGGLTVLLGGSRFFDTGRYVRYPTVGDSLVAHTDPVGPALNRLWVSVLQFMGQTDTAFGTTATTSLSGQQISLTGALTELHR